MDDGDISQFCAITAASPDVARGFLDMAGSNLEAAIQLFFENPDIQTSFSSASATAGASRSAPPPVPTNTRPGIGRQDERGVIHLDSDDEGDAPMVIDDDDDEIQIPDDDEDEVVAVARTAQEEEDAAMAKRLQEELYSETGGADAVRSPIARTTETLVGPNSYGGHGDEMDMNTIIQQQMQARRRAELRNAGGSRNPFNHGSIWDDPNPRPTAAEGEPYTNRQARLAELFRPPYDLMSRFDWDEAREAGKDDKKWMLVNLQDMSDFNCQALNRDIWKDAAVRDIVKENFIFLQYNKGDIRAEHYINLYFPGQSHENPDNFPHVSIIDPRTGEQVKIWSGRPFPTASDFHSQLAEFLDRYSLAANSKNPVASQTAQRPRTIDVDRMTEEEMLEMALQNSLAATNGGSSQPKSNVADPDALTKAPAGSSTTDGGKGKEPMEPVDLTGAKSPEPTLSQSLYATISSNKPHAEPENNAATTTRIQFRHPNGRVIRRFALDDPVRRIYEWLKAEPIEGKEGTEFELKRMPQGQDLSEELEKSIADAGLKQGTVMIEFIED